MHSSCTILARRALRRRPGQARLLASSIGHPVVIWTRFGTGFTLDGTHWIRTSQGKSPLDHGGDGARRCQFPARRLAAPERTGRREAAPFLAEASRLHPDSWNIWRQAADIDEVGKASGPEFWARTILVILLF